MFQFTELQFCMACELNFHLECPGINALHHVVFQHLCRRFLDCLRLLRMKGEREETDST